MERKQTESSLDMADLVVVKNTKKLVKINHFGSIFMHADSVDMLLMSLGCIGAFGDGLSSPMMMLILSKVMNSLAGGLGSDLGHNISKNAFNFLYLALWSLCVAFLEGYCWTRTGERQASRMRYKYLKAVLRQDVGYFDLSVTRTSEVITSVSNDTLVIQDAIGEKMPNLLMNMFKFLASYIVGFVLSWRLAIVGLPFALLLIIPGLTYGWILIGVTRKIREEYNKAGAVVEQAISSIRTVYSFVGEDKTKNKFSHALQGSVKLGLKQGLVKGVAIGSTTVTFAIWAFMSWYGSELIIHDKAKGGSVYAVGALNAIGGISLGAALSNLAPLSEACSAGERIMEVIKRVPKIDSENMEGEVLPSVSGEIEFKSIEFAYPSRPDSIVLQDFNLKVPAGKTIALVGGSGSGKSTVIALLERFYNPVSGEILLDGIPIDKFQLKWLRSQMGLVSQEPALFATSIRENILFGKDDATFEEVIAAAKASNAHNFISQLSQGYDTQVGERGIQMSGGQKQRIAIARAIVKTPRVLLLDEATSALDSESEKVVQEALDNAAVGRTTLVIAHRLSTIRNVDVIVVVQNGHVMETGSHEKLIQHKNGMYSSFVRLQQIEQKIEEENTSTLLTSSSHIRNGDTNHSSQRLSLVNQSGTVNLLQGTRVSSVDENTTKSTPPPSFRRLLLLNIPEWKQGILGCTSAMLSGAVQPIHSFMLGGMITVYFLSDHDEIRTKNRIYSLTAFGLAVFSLIVNICQHYNFAAMGEYLTKRIRERMLSKIMTFEVGWYDQEENSSGAVCSRLDRDANTVRSLVGDRMALLLQTLSAVTVACTMGIVIAWRFAIVMIASQPLIIMCFYFRKVSLQKLSRKAIVSQDESSKLAAEAVSNHRTVTAYSSQSRILEMLDRAQDEPRRENIRQAWYAGIVLGVASSLSACSWALDFWYGGRLISQGRITAKELFQTHMVLINTGRVIADAGSMTTDLAKSVNTVGSVFSVLDRHTQIDSDDPEGYKPEQLSGCIELHYVHFAYPARTDTMIFKGFSLTIEAGQSTALVGQSGSGKSTIISLIERFYDPLMGTVKIDGRDVRSYNLKSLRKHIAIVSQEPTLFSGTIKENILYGASYMVDEAEIINAAKAANAHDFIAGLKDGYNTCCGNKGLQLSGGQKQRIAIARAILVNPRILLLDEATSALDSQSEKVVQDALDLLMVGRTSVVVAHRLSTIRNCHTIVVLDKGVVVEKGNHSSLFAKGPSGAYYGLVSIQQQQKPNTHQPLG